MQDPEAEICFRICSLLPLPMFARVCLLGAPFSELTYSLPPGFPEAFWVPGLRVLVPVGKTLRSGFILDLARESGLPPDIKCRELVFPLETTPLIDSGLLNLARALGARQGLPPGAAPGYALPAGLRSAELKVALCGGKKQLSGRAIAALARDEYGELVRDLLSGKAQILKTGQSQAELEICAATLDPPWPLRPAATRQIEILDFLYEHGPVSRARLAKALGGGIGQPLQKLLQSGLVRVDLGAGEEIAQELLPPPQKVLQLNPEQEQALADLVSALDSDTAQTRLVYGITGSGKTAVYLELCRACLERGRPCFLLAPEVALAHKLRRDVVESLPEFPHYFYHGYQHPVQREQTFRKIAAGTGPFVIVGTRSALFLPVKKPGCIILDEEHDSSYKQDESPPYHAKELAWFRISQAGGLLALGSATPDIRTFHASQNGKVPAVHLKQRAGGASLPPVELVSLTQRAGFTATTSGEGLLAPASEKALTECLTRGEQAVILLNRRGYSPLIFCLGCEKTIQCPHCQIGLAYHKKIGRLVCHYCGYSLPWPSPCPECGATNYIPIGEGTEKIAERLQALSGQPVLRLDRDSARRPGSIEDILSSFGAGKASFLVGTQMLSKGHHFPNVTLVVVADGDIGLNLPDYRAAERTFQLLVQSAGRAGRGNKQGRALIQTRNPSHYCWQHILDYDYEGFYSAELALRRKYVYPPFTRLGLLRFSWLVTDEAAEPAARELGQEIRRLAAAKGVVALGPAPAPIAIIRGRKRFHCLLKADDWQPMRELWFCAKNHPAAKRMRISLDLDPANML